MQNNLYTIPSGEVPAKVPGCMYTAFIDAGLIEEPYFGFNDLRYRGLGWDACCYSRKFTRKF